MAKEEKQTYFGYREGIDPRLLSLGSLVFDLANPRVKDPYIHPPLAPEELEEHAVTDNRSNCWLSYTRSRGCSFGGGFVNLAELNASRDKSAYSVVIAESGSKVELVKPTKFFEEVVLNSDEARLWLETRLSVSRSLKHFYGMTLQHPKIWFLSGLYLMKDATSLSVSGNNTSHAGSLTTPLPDPFGIAAALQVNPKAEWSTANGLLIGGGSTLLGSRVWAAQFHPVKARYFEAGSAPELGPKYIRLLTVVDLRTERGECPAAEVNIEKGTFIAQDEDDHEDDQLPSEYWDKFLEEVKDLKEDLE